MVSIAAVEAGVLVSLGLLMEWITREQCVGVGQGYRRHQTSVATPILEITIASQWG